MLNQIGISSIVTLVALYVTSRYSIPGVHPRLKRASVDSLPWEYLTLTDVAEMVEAQESAAAAARQKERQSQTGFGRGKSDRPYF